MGDAQLNHAVNIHGCTHIHIMVWVSVSKLKAGRHRCLLHTHFYTLVVEVLNRANILIPVMNDITSADIIRSSSNRSERLCKFAKL